MRKETTLLTGVAAIVALAIASEALAWGGYHQFSEYFSPSNSPDYINPSTSRSPDYFSPANAGANNPFSDYFNPAAVPQNGRFGPHGFSPAYGDPNYGGYSRRW